MYPPIFLSVLTVLLGIFAPSLALPVQSSDSLLLRARLFDLSPDTTPLISRDFDTELLIERGYEDESDLRSRAPNEDLFPRAKRPKRTATEAAQRKAGVRAAVSANQANKPAPRPNFAKGEHLKDQKAVQKQAEARARLQAKKAAGRNAHASANIKYAETKLHGNMPNRQDQYHVPGYGNLYGKDVRAGAYNLGMYEGKGGRYPSNFRNDLQGPRGNRHRPLPHMVGSGKEYPIKNVKGGYHPWQRKQGPVRTIYGNNPAGGYNVIGVVSHDVTLPRNHPGSRDHHQIHGTPAPAALEGAGGTILPGH